MNFDFNVKDWDLNSQIIAGAVVLGFISLFLPWFGSGSWTINGLRFWGIFPLLFMGYPAYVVLTRDKMNKNIALTCATISFSTVAYFFLGMNIDGDFSAPVGFGMFVYLLAAAACYYGVYKYETPVKVEPQVITTATPEAPQAPVAEPTEEKAPEDAE